MSDGSKLTGQFIDDKAEGSVEFEDKGGHIFQTENDDSKGAKVTNVSKSVKSKKISSGDGSMNSQTDRTNQHPAGIFQNGKLYK